MAIPVYFDAAFVILVSIAKQLSQKTGIPLARYITALSVGLIIGHCVIIPTPGPMAVAGTLDLPLGPFVVYAILISVLAAMVGGVLYSKLTVKKFFPEQCTAKLAENVSFDTTRASDRCPGGLAILLILIILGSVGFIMAREHMHYDADGNLHFDLPWDKGTSDPVEAPGDPDVVIREPEQTAVKTPVRGTLLAAKPLTMEDQETAETPLSEAAVTAVTLKDSAGRVYFDSSAAVTGAVSVKPDTGEALNDLTARTDVTAAARIACFHDPKAANADVEGMGLKNTGGYIFYDGNNSQWLDPGHEKARTYLLNIIREAAEQGFREIILTDVSYPTAGKLDKIDFSNAMTAGNTAEAGRQVQIEGFLREVRDALPKNVILSLELPAETVLAGTNSDAGQELSALAPLVDRIYAETTEAEASALETAVKAASAACGFVPELTEQPAEGTENWLLIQK